MPVSSMPIPLVVVVIIAVFSLFVILGIFAPRASASTQKIENLWSNFGSSQAESGSIELGYKALHAKIKPGNEPKIFEFHPTDQGALGNRHFTDESEGIRQYFDIKKWNDKKCVLFATKVTNVRTLGLKELDKNYVYYVDAGTIISSDAANLQSAINGRYERGCETIKCGDFNTGDYTVCATECTIMSWSLCKERYEFECDESAGDEVLNQRFGSGESRCSEDTTGCPSNGCCSLLRDNPAENYKLAGGLMCGYAESEAASAKWWACARQNAGMSVYTKMKGEPNSAQYRCEAKTSGSETSYEWVAAANQGIALENAQIKYTDITHIGIPGESETYIEFILVNNQVQDINNAKVSAKVADPENSVDCSYLTDTPYADSVEKPANIPKNGGTFKYSHDNFCYKAKTFDVKIEYQTQTKNFRIECKNADSGNENWQKCESAEIMASQVSSASSRQTPASGSAQIPTTALTKNIGENIVSEFACNSKKYDIKYEGSPPDSVLLEIKEDGQIKPQGQDSRWTIRKGSPETIGNLKITLYDIGAASPYTAKIGAECAVV